MKTWTKLSPPLLSTIFLVMIMTSLILSGNLFINNEVMMILEWELLSMNGLTIFVPLLIDKISLVFSTVVMLISFSVMLFSASYMSKDPNMEYFIMMVMMFILSMNLLIFFPNMIALLMGWDGLGLSSYLLVIYYLNDKSLAAGMITALTNRIGDSLLILAASWAFIGGHWNTFSSTYAMTSFTMLMIMLAAMTKSAQMPFSAWLPAAMAAPTPVSALVHSSTLVTAGIYLIIRFFPSLSTLSYFMNMCFYTGMMTCLMASLAASMEMDLKKIIALSTLSQLGVMMMSLGLNKPLIAFFHLVTHALFKALLFICAGNIIHSMNNNQDIRLMGNISTLMPLTATSLNVANMSLCGLPFMAGFYSKDMIVEYFMMSNMPIISGTLMMTSICLTSVYTMKMSLITLWAPFKGASVMLPSDQSKLSSVSYIILLTGAITGGSMFYWLLMPSLEPAILPTSLKMLTLTLIVLLALTTSYLLSYSKPMPLMKFLSSMWYLTFITTSPLTMMTMSFSKTISYNELTWMENMSSMGLKKTIKKITKKSQKASNMNLSTMMSLMMMITTMMMVCY